MNTFLGGAAVLALLVGAAHSVLGERLIFTRMRRDGLVPTNGGALLPSRQVRILWASWHLVTILGWGCAAILWRLADEPVGASLRDVLLQLLSLAMLLSAIVVGGATRGRHPGWIGLLAVAALTWWGVSHPLPVSP